MVDRGGSQLISIPEILQLIFEESDKPTLASCARICRLWSEVALDVLWRDLPSLIPLILLVGSVEITDEMESNSEPQLYTSWVQTVDFLSVDWDCIRSYARRVRSLVHDEDGWETYRRTVIDFHDFMTLISGAASTDSAMCLPHLTSLEWAGTSNYQPSHALQCLPFMGPSLQSLKLTVYNSELVSPQYSGDATLVKLFSVLRFRYDVHLRHFEIELTGDGMVEDMVLAFLKTQYQLVSLDIDEVSTIQVVAESLHPEVASTLRTMSLGARGHSPQRNYRPLTKFPNLEDIEVGFPYGGSYVVSDFKCIAESWPRLRRWTCGGYEGQLEDLLDMAALLPNIERLSFGLDLRGRLPSGTRAVPYLSHLVLLDTSYGRLMPISEAEVVNIDVHAIASVLTTMTPDTAEIVGYHASSSRASVWASVEAEIRAIRAGKADAV